MLLLFLLFGLSGKMPEILFTLVVNSLILKLIAIFTMKIFFFLLEAGYDYQVGFVYVIVPNHVNWHR